MKNILSILLASAFLFSACDNNPNIVYVLKLTSNNQIVTSAAGDFSRYKIGEKMSVKILKGAGSGYQWVPNDQPMSQKDTVQNFSGATYHVRWAELVRVDTLK